MYPNFNKPAFLTNTSTPGFGSNLFGKTNSTGFGATPSTSTFGQPTANSSMFSSLQPSGLFQTSSTSSFNAVPSTQSGFTSNLFGQQAQPSTSGLFGSSTNAFGANKPSFGFGNTPNQTTGLFGQQQPQQAATSLFQSNTSNLFGSSSNTFGNQNQVGTVVKFQPVTGTDTMQKNGVTQSICTKHHCITCMKEYESKSLEELRYEDYSCNRKGPQQQQTGFGTTTGFGQQTTTNPPSLFGQVDNKSVLGQNTTAFQNTNNPTSTFGQNTTGFGLTTNQSTTPSLFGAKTTGFGVPNNNANTSFGFGNTANQSATNNPFGNSNQQTAKPFGQSLFGTPTTQQTTFNTSGGGVFGQTNQPNTNTVGGGLFSKPTTSVGGGAFNQTNTGFAFNAPTSTTSPFQQANKPNTGFGFMNNNNNNASAFGQNQAGFGTNTTGFGKPIASTFGQPQAQTSFGGFQNQPGSLFSNTNANKPGGLFSNTNTSSTGLFGNTNFQQQPSAFNLSLTSQQQQQPMQFPPQNNDETKNIQLLATDILADGPHIYGLKPILNNPSESATNPQDIKALLDKTKNEHYLKKSDIVSSSKIKVQSPKPKRNSNKEFFDANFALKSSRKCLIIKKPSDVNENVLKKYDNELLKEVEESLKKSNNSNNLNQLDLSNIQPITTTNNNDNNEILLKNIQNDSNRNNNNNSGSRENNSVNLSELEGNKLIKGIATSTIINPEVSTSKIQFDNSIENVSINRNNNEVIDEINPVNNESNPTCDNSYGVILTRAEYYMYPPVKDLNNYIDENGDCIVQGLTIGRYGYGNVYFPDAINIKNMNFDQIVFFRHREIIIYPDETIKPPVGQGLNRRAQVTLDKIYPRDKNTNNYVTNVDLITQSNFIDKLINVTEKHNSKFVEYRPKTGSWVFKVKHFSKFGFTDSDEEECKINTTVTNDDLIDEDNDDNNEKIISTNLTINNKSDNEIKKIGLGGLKQAILPPQTITKELITDDESLLLNDWINSNQDSNYFIRGRTGGDELLLKNKLLMNNKSSSIQLMKSVLFQQEQEKFEQEPTIDHDIIKDLDTDENLLKNLIITSREVDEISSTNKEVVSLPNIFPVPSLVSALPEDYFSKQIRCYTDLNIFKGDAYKNGWLNGLNFFKLQRIYDFKMSYELNQISIQTHENDDLYLSNLTEALEIALNESEFTFSSTSIPTLKIKNNLNYLKNQTNLFNNLIDKNNEKLKYLSSVWHLCSALWDGNDNRDYIRRERLSDWFKLFTTNSFDNQNDTEIILKSYNKLENEKLIANKIFDLLTINKLKEASNLAINNNLDYLSLLISQLNLNEQSKLIMKQFLKNYIWEINKIPNEFKRIYLLLAGVNEPQQNVNIFDNLDWKRCFGIHLWYIAPKSAPINIIVDLFEKSFNENCYSIKPLYLNNENEYDLLYNILLLYVKTTYQLSVVLNPTTHTNNSLDYRLSWLLLQLFLSLKVGLIDENELNYLHINFANQLENMNLWKWSIFVLLYLKDDLIKKDLIMKILERNLNLNDTDNIENDLVNVMKIPVNWLHEIKANKTTNYYESFKHFTIIQNWHKANDILINKILPNLFINNQLNYLNYFISCIKPGEKLLINWNSEIGLINDFLKLQDMIDSLVVDDENQLIPIRIRFNSICQRLIRFPINNDQQKLCIAELSRKCAGLFKVFYKHLDLNEFQTNFIDLIDNLIMPADYKHYEIFNLIGLSIAH